MKTTVKTANSTVTLIKEHDSLHYVQIASDSLTDSWKLPYPVYQFQLGDVDSNGKDDILVGVIKTTRFDSIKGKRLFIFKNYKGYVRPLWLGSRLSKPLVDFKFVKNNQGNYVRSIEREKSGKFLVAEYQWRRFGLEFKRYIKREIDKTQASEILKNKS
ncbi:nuclear receptor-binding factor 2 [Aquimarina litoralis]|nr:nuclear receptor-binding factor 2 [Aquimarina litoralis]